MLAALNLGPDEWLTMFADPMRAQSAIDRLTGNADDLIIEGESYRLSRGNQVGMCAAINLTRDHAASRS